MPTPIDTAVLRKDDLADAQHVLGRAIGRARAGEDREFAQKVREGGETLAHLFGGLLKMSRVHAADNRAFDQPIDQLVRALSSLVNLLGPVHLVAVEDQILVNDVRIRSDEKGSAADLGGEFAKHNIGGARFHAPLDAGGIRALIDAFSAKPGAVSPRRDLQQALFDGGVQSVDLSPRYRFRKQGREADAEKRDPSEALLRTVNIVQEMFDNVAAGRILNPLPLRRSVVELLDIGPEHPDFWEALRGPSLDAAPHAVQAVSVALLALLIGNALGMRPAVLQDLGVAALALDIGYARLPTDARSEGHSFLRHPGEGARVLLLQRGFHETKLRRLRAVLDHHRDHMDPRAEPSLAGEILRLAEDYTTWCRAKAEEFSPADVLSAMGQLGGATYNPTLMQLMINTLGKYPPGTLLELNDGRFARSASPVREPDSFAMPLVRVCTITGKVLGAEREETASGRGIYRALAG